MLCAVVVHDLQAVNHTKIVPGASGEHTFLPLMEKMPTLPSFTAKTNVSGGKSVARTPSSQSSLHHKNIFPCM